MSEARLERICEQCAATFRPLARCAKRPGRGRFCGRSCQSRFFMRRRLTIGGPLVGDKNPGWKGGVATDGYRYAKRFRAKSPEKYRVQQATQSAIKSGLLVRPDVCSQCRVACKPHAHHDDYTKPMAVRWLCQLCHNRHHAALRTTRKKAA